MLFSAPYGDTWFKPREEEILASVPVAVAGLNYSALQN